MVRRSLVIDQWAKKILGRGGVYSEFFDDQKLIYIHCPKSAGTSISMALYGGDPWHFSAKELQLISPISFRRYYKFSFVRNPWSRIFSSYSYGRRRLKGEYKKPFEFMSDARSFEDFVLNFMTESVVREHYFFWPHSKYCGLDDGVKLDFYGRFETLTQDVVSLENVLERKIDIPFLNVGAGEDYRDFYSAKMVDKIHKLYLSDSKGFGYSYE